MKLIHPFKDLVISCKTKDMYEEAMKRPDIQFYEFISFIRNYLDSYVFKSKFQNKRKMPHKKKKSDAREHEPKITKLAHPDDYEVVEGFFNQSESFISVNGL